MSTAISAASCRVASVLLRPLAASATASLLPPAAAPSPGAAGLRHPAGDVVAAGLVPELEQPPAQGDGCDFEHWLVVMEPPPGDAGNPDIMRDDIIDNYIKTLAQVVGSEEEARQKIYSVSTRHYFAFGALVSEELSYKLKELPKVRWVLPDSYLDVKNKDYGGEPFINGEAVPYDPKYHEEWVRNHARANVKPKGVRVKNIERRDVPPRQGFNAPPPPPSQNQMPPREGMRHNMSPPQLPHANGGSPNYQPQMPNPQAGYTPVDAHHYQQGGPPGGYQGSNQGYQGPAYRGYQGNPHQGGNQGYQGPAYRGPPPSYQGRNPNPPPYEGVNPNSPPYQGGNPITPPYPPPYQGGNNNPGYCGGPGYLGQRGNSNYR
ncbi:hypothetical protein BS78_K291500 [Paspalum vaginatum]|uniref:MORF/ORRM1/DAG-like MORF domain-containing protein n=1 Tax=Paspalum vaginatum TaxID=158149 RepID=A0A9W8CDT0_9POAL|nr:hypothetical protein BS78_K291500 [Paspalum vaginatum]